MSLDYMICIDGVNRLNARDAVLELHGLREISTKLNTEFQITHTINGPGLVIWLYEEEDLSKRCEWDSSISPPYVNLLLEANKFGNDVQICRTIATVVRALLQKTSGNVVFFFTQDEGPLLLRKDGIVLIDDEPENFWLHNASIIDTLDFDYTQMSLPKWL